MTSRKVAEAYGPDLKRLPNEPQSAYVARVLEAEGDVKGAQILRGSGARAGSNPIREAREAARLDRKANREGRAPAAATPSPVEARCKEALARLPEGIGPRERREALKHIRVEVIKQLALEAVAKPAPAPAPAPLAASPALAPAIAP